VVNLGFKLISIGPRAHTLGWFFMNWTKKGLSLPCGSLVSLGLWLTRMLSVSSSACTSNFFPNRQFYISDCLVEAQPPTCPCIFRPMIESCVWLSSKLGGFTLSGDYQNEWKYEPRHHLSVTRIPSAKLHSLSSRNNGISIKETKNNGEMIFVWTRNKHRTLRQS
jgi:hypothetical protein